MKRNIFKLILCCTVFLSGCGMLKNTSDTSGVQDVAEHDNAKEKEDFIFSENLKAAILPIALGYDSFETSEVHQKDWKEFFVSGYLLNSRNSYDYLEQISEKNEGSISDEDMEYIHESLTGEKMDFSDYSDTNTKDSSSSLCAGQITGCTYEKLSDGNIRLKADLAKIYDGSDYPIPYSLSVILTENPESCFDGYSIVKLTCEELSAAPIPSGEKTFVGTVYDESEWADENTCTVEYSYSDEELGYAHFVYLDVSGDHKLKAELKRLVGNEVKITYTEGSREEQLITKVIPIAVERK